MSRSKDSELNLKILQYTEEGLSRKAIADLLDVHVETIARYLRSVGIKGKVGKPSNDFKVNIDKPLKDFIVGWLLGDGSITKHDVGNSCLSIAHGHKQKEYCEWKHNFLNNYGLVNKISYNKIENERYTNGYIEEVRFKSKSHQIFNKLRDDFYKDGKKIYPINLINSITPFSLAILYMDDGYATNDSCIISTCSFSDEELNNLQTKLLQSFNIKTTLNKAREIYILKESFDTFIETIKEYVIDSMKYKLVPYNIKSPV